METHVWTFFVAALVPLIVGFVWYNPKAFGAAWLKYSGLSEEEAAGGNKAVMFGLSYLFGLFIASILYGVVVHQSAIMSLMFTETDVSVVGSEAHTYYTEIMERLGDRHRSFGHGALHGTFAGLLFALPVLAINSIFERRGFKYIAINAGYWILTLALMGGVLGQWA